MAFLPSRPLTSKPSKNTVNILPKSAKNNETKPMTSDQKWNTKFLELAKHISSWSKDTTKIGAVIAEEGPSHDVVSMGYNGFPRGFQDTGERFENRVVKYNYTVHAEVNAICTAARKGKCLNGTTLYVYGLPVCHECAKTVIQAGIKRVIVNTMEAPPQWMSSTMRAAEFFKEAKVEYRKINI